MAAVVLHADEAGYFHDEDSGAADLHFQRHGANGDLPEHRQPLRGHKLCTGATFAAGEFQHHVNILVLNAGEDGHAAAPQETAA